jgi:hypothetical protein
MEKKKEERKFLGYLKYSKARYTIVGIDGRRIEIGCCFRSFKLARALLKHIQKGTEMCYSCAWQENNIERAKFCYVKPYITPNITDKTLANVLKYMEEVEGKKPKAPLKRSPKV